MLTARALSKTDWPEIERLFGANGACGGCWCMFWRVPSGGKYWAEAKGEKNRRSFKALVETGAASGVLAFDGKVPVAWASVAPRSDFAYFSRTRTIPPAADERAWSVTCLFVARSHRRRGATKLLLETATDLARSQGARVLEGYPSAPKPKRAQADAFIHTGIPTMFQAAGFKRAAKAGAREVWRIAL
jgi:GNAT superfamily N-acetyltransferase